jgi:carbon storage regulator CsrA
MLVLTRRKHESLIIDGRITVTVIESKSGKVRIGISAPPDVSVDRAEVHVKKCSQLTLEGNADATVEASSEINI